jgi:N-acetylglucosaminyl-diphospho-decaprenol L-rhamnosyltransferase
MPDSEAAAALDLSIIIVNWNTRSLIKQCLESLPEAARGLSFEIIVVDNASQDGSSEMIARDYPGIRLIQNQQNVGFARANNQGFRTASDSRFLLLLNTDALPPANALRRMVEFLKKNPRAGAVGPALRYPDGRPQLSGGHQPSAVSAFCYFLYLSRLAPGACKGLFVNDTHHLRNSGPIELGWISGTCLMIRRSVLDRAGPLDEGFFMYAEDAEWCERIQRAGWRLYLLPDLEVIHIQGGSSSRVSIRWLQALIQLVQTRRGSAEALLFRLSAAFGLSLRALGYLGFSVFSNRPEYYKKASQMWVYARGALR